MGKTKRTDMEDRISELPELVLSSILSKLPPKDIIRTGVLSKAWKQHRELIEYKLDLHLLNLLESKYTNGLRRHYHLYDHGSKVYNYKHFLEVRREFMNRVDKVLHHFKSSKITSLKVTCFLDSGNSSDIDCWINSAIAFGVEELQLLCSNDVASIITTAGFYKFPYWFFKQSFLRHLKLERCILTPTSDFTGFSKLLTLSLRQVRLCKDFCDSLFTNCSLLQELTLDFCDIPVSSVLRIVSASLQQLSLLNNYTTNLSMNVEIYAVNLFSFTYTSFIEATTVLFHTPSLANFCFDVLDRDTTCLLSQVATLPSLEILSFFHYPCQPPYLDKLSFQFGNLKQLKLVYDEYGRTVLEYFTWLFDILQACPVLKKFQISFLDRSSPNNKEEIGNLCGYTYKTLKEMKMTGSTGNWNEIELILFILKNAIALERVIIEPSLDLYNGKDLVPREGKSSESVHETFRRSLQNKIPHGVELVIR
ncbi:putative FBD-associated F-box protein At1g61330 [Mercurialis annua]|uniref:putative FBD-associated F-box protein At1g61330 n=1 Tax=Mercurialis annua TaxID=3986 RepID=UPI00215FCD42|nr:putative FBD-associated F-box protein At1g61330 [Mercurialis annua]XP_055961546.1 putative FBD-associated F-box protein At1g61330 [Mercurialis annua]